ncbi:TetR family transcriptional regulator [Kribbella sp. VKM Ac-2569]|uniref:TetR/AcrR family transcriptional regulator n=1 Tax=Kribbella sp. VKM Ac-2569 TaxID=2512220 RepID=UPI0010E1B1EA|nr:TetR/AcrR family transcriptional regulator [Kribbella sp. VKM Ac-2569]RZT15178.1 TetR family transcriptional regulator [Kribbella sp. VKM Ac-2569]
MSEIKPVRRRRRADADRSRAAILAAAIVLLDEQPDASLERIAEAAHVTRQTVYAHFSSRDVLLNAALDELTAETLEAIDALDLDQGPALGNVLRLIDLAWRTFERHPLLLHLPHTSTPNTPQPGTHDERHDPVADRLERLIRRGQRAGEITRDLPAHWLVTTLITLGHAAGESVATGRLTTRTANKTLHTTITRLLQPT